MKELQAWDERGKKAMVDAARLTEEYRQEQERSLRLERARKTLETSLKVNPVHVS